MVRPKAQSKQQQKRGIDFKKIKRKIGRKLPPPKNATNTEIKSKAIILPEQSVASEKTGLAVSRKGLTLRELLQQTSHHNPKVRKDALIGIRDIFLKYPAELKLHKLAVIEKLRERISDDDKLVRETLYQLLKSVIFPHCKEDNQGPFISLMMAYIFNAMTHLAVDVRLMAFKFFDLLVQHFPSSFSLHAEKILQNYEDVLRKNQFYLQDKGKLKSTLTGLARCLAILPCNMVGDNTSSQKDANARETMHAFEPEERKDSAGYSIITQKLKDLIPVLVSCFLDFVPTVHAMPLLDAQSFDCILFILQSIDLVVRFFVYGIDESQQQLQVFRPPNEGPGIITWGQTISPVLLKKLFDVFPLNSLHHLPEKDDHRCFSLNVIITETFMRLSDYICPPTALLEKFLEFIESALTTKVFSRTQSGKAFEKQLVSLTSFLPKLVLQVVGNRRSCILQAFTTVFKNCSPESALKLACLSAIEEILVPGENSLYLDGNDPEILDYQITWVKELPLLLILLDDKHPSASKVVLHLLLRLGRCAPLNSFFVQTYDNMQFSLREFYCTCLDESSISYGPFIRLSRDSQELSICCLYYFSSLDPLLLKSLALCCICPDLEPFVLFRVIEVLHSAYKAGHIQIADQISFFITLTSCFKVIPERICSITEKDEISNWGTLKSITSVVCSCLLQMGDDYLVFHILEKVVLNQISLKLPLDNICALLRMLVTLDSIPTRLSEESVINLSSSLPGYLIDVVSCIPEYDEDSTIFTRARTSCYYLQPCFILFYRNEKLLHLVLNMMGALVAEKTLSLFSGTCIRYATDLSTRITSVVSILLLMHKDVKAHRILSSCKAEIDCILQNMLVVQSSEKINMTIEELHKVQCAIDRLKTITVHNTV